MIGGKRLTAVLFSSRGRTQALTLVEILVATFILAILGTALAIIMRSGMFIWRGGESEKRTLDDFSYAYDYLYEDLTAVFTSEEPPPSVAPDRPIPVKIKLISDYDSNGFQRLIFVRTLPGTLKNAFGTNAGNLIDDDDDQSNYASDGQDNDLDDLLRRNDGLDNDNDESTARTDGVNNDGDSQTDEAGEGVDEADETGIDEPFEGVDEEWLNQFDDDDDGEIDEDLRALGSLMQVIYYIEPPSDQVKQANPRKLFTYKLCRGFQAPVASVRRDALPEYHGFYFASDPPGEAILSNVLYFGVKFWTQKTRTWEYEIDPSDPDSDGYEIGWDSTRGIPGSELGISGNLFGYRGSFSLNDPTDDIFPEKVRITLVLLPRIDAFITRLGQALNPDTTGEIILESTKRLPRSGNTYIRIQDEWIYYEGIKDEKTIIVPAGGRGRRGTTPASHPAGSEVAPGRTLEFTVSLPSYRIAKDIQ